MKKFKISSLFKFIYLGIIIFFLYSFYTEKEIHTYNIDNLKIVETSSVDFPMFPKKIRSLEVTYKGLSFYMSERSRVTLISDDNITRNSQLLSIKIEDDILELKLENDLILFFRVDNNGNRLTINTTIPKVFPTIREVSIPYTLNETYTIEENDLSYSISNDNEEFHLKLNDKYFIDTNHKRIHLKSEDDKIPNLTFSPLNNNELPLLEQWYRDYKKEEIPPIDDMISGYLTKIYKSINLKFDSIKYYPEDDNWKNLPTPRNFTENEVIVYLSKAMENRTYAKRLQKIKGLKKNYSYKFGYQSAPYLGNIIQNGKKGTKDYNTELNRIKKLIYYGEKDLLKSWIPEYYFTGKEIDLVQLEKRIDEQLKNDLTLEELSNALHNIIFILDSVGSSNFSIDNVTQVTDLILNKIKWDENGLFLIDNNSDTSDQTLNLRLGVLLIEASEHETSEYSKPIGEALIQTYINNSSNNGEVKTTYNIKTKEFSNTTINSEDTFLQLTDNQYVPHYYQQGGINIWTISNSITINKSTQDIKITMSYPVDRTSTSNSHFFTITGLRDYTQIDFKGQIWRADKDFEKWGVGYYFDSTTRILFFMPTHTKSREEITITY